MSPMTYTARATLEIGSGSVCSGRAVTTTTASNQVRTPPSTLTRRLDHRDRQHETDGRRRFPSPAATKPAHTDQTLLMSALRPKYRHASNTRETDRGGGGGQDHRTLGYVQVPRCKDAPRGPMESTHYYDCRRDRDPMALRTYTTNMRKKGKVGVDWNLCIWLNNVNQWYEGLMEYSSPVGLLNRSYFNSARGGCSKNTELGIIRQSENQREIYARTNSISNNSYYNGASDDIHYDSNEKSTSVSLYKTRQTQKEVVKIVKDKNKSSAQFQEKKWKSDHICNENINTGTIRKHNRIRVGSELVVPNLSSTNPKNIRNMTIGEPSDTYDKIDGKHNLSNSINITSDTNKYINIPFNSKISNKQMEKEEVSHSAVNPSHFEPAIDESVASDNVDQISNNLFINKADEAKAKEKLCMLETKVNIVDNLGEGIPDNEIELIDIPPNVDDTPRLFSQYIADQQKLFQALQDSNITNMGENAYSITEIDSNLELESAEIITDLNRSMYSNFYNEIGEASNEEMLTENSAMKCTRCCGEISRKSRTDSADCNNKSLAQFDKNVGETVSSKRYILAELPNNAYIVLTLSKRLLAPLGSTNDIEHSVQIEEIEGNTSDSLYVPDTNSVRTKTKKKKEKTLTHSSSSNKKKDAAINKNALKALLFENLLKSDRNDKQNSAKPDMTSYINNEVGLPE